MFVTKDPVLAFLCSQEPEDHVRVRRAVSPPEKIIALTAKLCKVGFGKHFFPQVQFYDGCMHVHDPATGAYSQGVHVCRRTPCRWEGASLIPGVSEGFHSVTVFQFCYHSQQSVSQVLGGYCFSVSIPKPKMMNRIHYSAFAFCAIGSG